MRIGPAILLLVPCLHSFAQQAITASSIVGTVQDQTGSAVADAQVKLFNPGRNRTQTTASDATGRYEFLYLPPGDYALTVADPRFIPIHRTLVLRAGQTAGVALLLAIAGVNETVTIDERVAALDPVRAGTSEVVLPEEIDALPINGRNYLDLALLVPGVSRTNTGAAQRFAETSAVPGTGISIAGQRNLNNTFIIDGLSANDDAADLAGTAVSQEVVREFQIVTSGGIAEFGRASSGIVNITTQSGGSQWHARVYDFFRNQRLDARNPFAAFNSPLTQSQYGASLSGPVFGQHTFLFSNFEQTRQNASGVVTIAPANISSINADLIAAGYRGPLASTGEFPTGLESTNFFARADHEAGAGHRLSLRYALYDAASTNARGAGGLSAITRGSALQNRDQNVAAGDIAAFSPKVLNEARAQFTHSRLGAPVNDNAGPAINISGIANLGTATSSPTARDADSFEVSEAIAIERGAHFLKFGADWLYNRVNIVFPGALQGVYNFQNLAALQAGRYLTFQQAFGAPSQLQSNPNAGVFVQDQWRLGSNFTANLGLRYDVQRLPDPIRTDRNNIAPRAGIAYSPGNRKTVVRASFGLYYDRIPLRATSNALQRDGSKYRVAAISFGQASAPVFPDVLPAFPAAQLIGTTTIDTRIQNGSSTQASFEIEHAFNAATTLSVGYLHVRGEHLILSRNINAPTLSASGAAALGIANLGRPDPRYANVSRYESSGDSYYNGLLLSFQHRAARNLRFRLSYNYSRAIDDTGNFFFSAPQNNSNLRDDRGPSDNDQRHRLTVAATFDSPRTRGVLGGWQLAPLFTYTSPLPFNVQLNYDRNNDTNLNDRPFGVGRNTGVGFGFTSLDMRLSRAFRITDRLRLQTLLESFNTLNHSNFYLPNNVIGSGVGAPLASFGQPAAAYDPRQLQIGLRLSF